MDCVLQCPDFLRGATGTVSGQVHACWEGFLTQLQQTAGPSNPSLGGSLQGLSSMCGDSIEGMVMDVRYRVQPRGISESQRAGESLDLARLCGCTCRWNTRGVCAEVAGKAKDSLVLISNSVTTEPGHRPCPVLVRPHLTSRVQLWASHGRKNIGVLEPVQRTAPELGNDLEHRSEEKQLREACSAWQK